jgi:hypothetical protein
VQVGDAGSKFVGRRKGKKAMTEGGISVPQKASGFAQKKNAGLAQDGDFGQCIAVVWVSIQPITELRLLGHYVFAGSVLLGEESQREGNDPHRASPLSSFLSQLFYYKRNGLAALSVFSPFS